MKTNWPECIEFTLQFEGGFDNTPKDRGNWSSGVIGKGELKGTKYGIASFVYPKLDIRNLTKAEAIAIYQRDYWPKVVGDLQPDGIDLIAWDICVNSGPGRAISIQAKALGVTAKSPTELAKLAKAAPDKVKIIKSMCAIRAAFYRSISTFGTFGKGWLRRNAAAEVKGVSLALRGSKKKPAASEAEIKKKLEAESKQADTSAKNNAGAGAGSVAGPAVVVPSNPETSWFDFATLGKIGFAIIMIGLAIYFARKFVLHRERAKAYTQAVKEMGV